MKKFNWIKKFHELQKKGNNWDNVSSIIPNEFDDYFLIHWNVGIVDSFPFDKYPEENDTIENINRRVNIDRKYGLFLNPKEDKLFRQTTLKEIANKFKVSYDYNVMDKIKETPAIKILEDVSIENLKSAVKHLTESKNLNLFVEDSFRYTNDDKLKQEITNISADDYFKWQEYFGFDYCTYLFPNNRKWCITTAEDFPMFLCVKREITQQVVKEFNMELFRIQYNEKLYQ